MKLKRRPTYQQKPAEVSRDWHVLDAGVQPLGRLASQAAQLLTGKGKPTYTPHVDGGDYVVVINSDKLVVSGHKETAKKYYRHSGYPGNLRSRSLADQRARDSRLVVKLAVRGMLPKNKLRAPRLIRLKVYQDDQHPHQGQVKAEAQQ